ncbi:hypothetical protein RHMOL_Rhmol08G0191900 [Rhododendron molle]|uniref:Uncharacterized protein n=1 Tax=Rhododendron molle TaxID=49168 RepID=A0ACC0MRC0_RHOML|nr:hypothetical protein RHMOL_Rhmol08G0191900 [Rhododendron molle]
MHETLPGSHPNHSKTLVSLFISMMARSKAKARKSVVPPIKVKVKKGAIVHEGSSSQKEQRKPSGFPVYVMSVMSEWWHEKYLRKYNDKTYEGSSSEEENDEEEEGHTDGRFHRAYMLFTLGCLMCPTTKEVAGNRLIPAVVAGDLETLKTYKWLAFVLDWLVNEIRNYKVRATKGCGRKAEGVGSSLFLLMICIDMYKELMRQFVNNSKSLHLIDAAMGKPIVGSPVVGSLQDGPRAEPVEDEGHSPQFSGNFKLHQYEEKGDRDGEDEEEGDKIQEKGSNLLAAESDEFSIVLRDDCNPDKIGYDVLKCDMVRN